MQHLSDCCKYLWSNNEMHKVANNIHVQTFSIKCLNPYQKVRPQSRMNTAIISQVTRYTLSPCQLHPNNSKKKLGRTNTNKEVSPTHNPIEVNGRFFPCRASCGVASGSCFQNAGSFFRRVIVIAARSASANRLTLLDTFFEENIL